MDPKLFDGLSIPKLRLGNRPQLAFEIPPDADQIKDAAPEPVPDAVFGDARHPRAMVDRNFFGGRPAAVNQDWQKAMPTVERENAVHRPAPEGAQGAAGVVKIRAQRGLSRPARNARGDTAQPVVLAIDPPAADEIHVEQFGEQPRQIRRVSLQTTVERRED